MNQTKSDFQSFALTTKWRAQGLRLAYGNGILIIFWNWITLPAADMKSKSDVQIFHKFHLWLWIAWKYSRAVSSIVFLRIRLLEWTVCREKSSYVWVTDFVSNVNICNNNEPQHLDCVKLDTVENMTESYFDCGF